MASPLLSITMPTRNRPELLERALCSLVTAMTPVAEYVEVTVSDGSDADTSGRVVERLLGGWPGGYHYVWNRPALTLVENMNRAAELATGEWVQQLDDDDLMLPSCGPPMIDTLRRAAPPEQPSPVPLARRGAPTTTTQLLLRSRTDGGRTTGCACRSGPVRA